MTVKQTEQSQKRKRGRPAGDPPTLASDQQHMRKAAAMMVRNEHLKFTTALKTLEVKQEKDLARLRGRWRKEQTEYLDQAKRILDAERKNDPLALVALWAGAMDDFVDEVARSSGLRDFIAAFGSFGDIIAEMRQSSGTIELPFDRNDPASVAGAVRRLEQRDKNAGNKLLQQYNDGADLTNAQRTYVTALILHELALKQLKEEVVDG